MTGQSRYARTEVVAQAAALQPATIRAAARLLDRALTSGAPLNGRRYEAQGPTTRAGVR